MSAAVPCRTCSQLIPLLELEDHLRQHIELEWRQRVEALQTQLNEARQATGDTNAQSQSHPPVNIVVPDQVVEQKVQEKKQQDQADMMETDEEEEAGEEEEDEQDEEESEEEDILMKVDELQSQLDGHEPTDAHGWMNAFHSLIECEEVADERVENNPTEQIKLLIKNATSAPHPPPSHTAMIPFEVRYKTVGEDVEEAYKLVYSADSSETALDEVVHQLDHLPESTRTLLEQMVAHHNTDGHPLKYCSVEEFHSMVDSHLHPSGGGEFEYVGKLVQQLESALRLSQQELAKYMKSKELDFNEMGPYMIEQKRIKEELIKQRAILFPLESPLWQACINYLKEAERSFDHDPRTQKILFPPTTAASSSANSTSNTSAVPIPLTGTPASNAPSSSSNPQISLDAAATMDKDTSNTMTNEADDPTIWKDDVDEEDEEELMDELLEEMDVDRSGRYQWMISQIDEYCLAGLSTSGDLLWNDVQAYLNHTTFIGEEVKQNIQFLFAQTNFIITHNQSVRIWKGWNYITDTPLDSSLPLNRKLLRALDALLDTVIELTDEGLDESEGGDGLDPCDTIESLLCLCRCFTEDDPDDNPLCHDYYQQLNEMQEQLDGRGGQPGSRDQNRLCEQQLREFTQTFIETQLLSNSTSEHQLLARDSLDMLVTEVEQRQTETIIPRRNIELLIREVSQDVGKGMEMTPEAIEAIHVAAEDYLIKQFDAAGTEVESMIRLTHTCDGCDAPLVSTQPIWKCQTCTTDFHCQSETNHTRAATHACKRDLGRVCVCARQLIAPPSLLVPRGVSGMCLDCSWCHRREQHVTHPASHQLIRLPPIQPMTELTTLNRQQPSHLNPNYRWSGLSQVESIH